MNGAEQQTEQQAHRPRYDGTINLGHILTASAMLLGGFVVWTQSQIVQAKQDVRIEYIERTAQKTADSVNKIMDMQQEMARTQEHVTATLQVLTKKPQL
jgi:hypothetical protein